MVTTLAGVCRCKSGPLFHILKFGCTTQLNEVPKGLTAQQEEQIEAFLRRNSFDYVYRTYDLHSVPGGMPDYVEPVAPVPAPVIAGPIVGPISLPPGTPGTATGISIQKPTEWHWGRKKPGQPPRPQPATTMPPITQIPVISMAVDAVANGVQTAATGVTNAVNGLMHPFVGLRGGHHHRQLQFKPRGGAVPKPATSVRRPLPATVVPAPAPSPPAPAPAPGPKPGPSPSPAPGPGPAPVPSGNGTNPADEDRKAAQDLVQAANTQVIPRILSDVHVVVTKIPYLANRGFDSFLQNSEMDYVNRMDDTYIEKWAREMAARIQVPAERVDDFISEISMIKFEDATSWQVYRFAFSTGQGAECKYVCVVGRHHDTEKQSDWLVANLQATFTLTPELYVMRHTRALIDGFIWTKYEVGPGPGLTDGQKRLPSLGVPSWQHKAPIGG
jgi:hypothetical protein